MKKNGVGFRRRFFVCMARDGLLFRIEGGPQRQPGQMIAEFSWQERPCVAMRRRSFTRPKRATVYLEGAPWVRPFFVAVSGGCATFISWLISRTRPRLMVVLMDRSLLALAGLTMLGTAAAAAAQAPSMSRDEARALYAAGGFPISPDGRNPTNRCGAPASPKITFVDMNGDGRKEALFVDAGGCYKPDGRWYAVATKGADGNWRGILSGVGSVQTTGSMANGWFVLSTTGAGKTQTVTYNGQSYGSGSIAAAAKPGGSPSAVAASSTPKTSPPSAPAAASVQSPAARDAAIFKAAGFKQTRRGWESGCDDASAGAPYDAGKIEQMKDLNGDGRPDAVVTEGGSYCYGNTGTAFWLVSQQPNGAWKLIYSETGIAEFLKTKGMGGWPDISVGGPGFCFPVVRWNGTAYKFNRNAYEGKACRP
jgi:hypothetical protein